jgi:hypothetical protein
VKALILAGAAALGLAACANDYVSVEQQACALNAYLAMQADPAWAGQSWQAQVANVAAVCLLTPAQAQSLMPAAQ